MNYFEYFLAFASVVSVCVSISGITSLVGVSSGTAIKSIKKKKKETLEETVLLAKAKLNFIKASVSKALIDFYINHDAIV